MSSSGDTTKNDTHAVPPSDPDHGNAPQTAPDTLPDPDPEETVGPGVDDEESLDRGAAGLTGEQH